MHTLLMLWVAASPVSGRVIDTEGKPVPNATVELRSGFTFALSAGGHCATGGQSLTVKTDDTGRFSASPEFEVRIANAEATDYVPVRGTHWDNWANVRGSRPVTLKLRKDPIVELEGTVVDAADVLIPGVVVAGWEDRGNRAVSDEAGHFKLKVRSSEKQLWVHRKNFEQNVYSRKPSPMRIELVRRPTMAVYLVDAAGKPIPGFNLVESFNANGLRVGESKTREVEGDCTLEGQLGELTVRATVNGKTVTQNVKLKDTQRIDVTLQF